MFDVLLELDNYATDSSKIELYNSLVKKYSHLLTQDEDGCYNLIIKDPVVADKFNENGVLGLNEFIYVIEKNSIYKYKNTTVGNQLVEVFDRNAGMRLKSTALVQETGPWVSEEIRYSVSSQRKIKLTIFCESYGDLGCSIGAHTSYHRKNWRSHTGDNRLEFSASKIEYTDTEGDLHTELNQMFFDNTKDRVNLTAATRYTTMDISVMHKIENPVVKFWRDTDGAGTAFLFDIFVIN